MRVRSIAMTFAVFLSSYTVATLGERVAWRARQPPLTEVSLLEPGRWANLPNGGLLADADDLNFGQVSRGTPFEVNLRLFNPTKRPVVVSKFETSCGITAWSDWREIPPGETKTVRIQHYNRIADNADLMRDITDRRLIIPVLPAHPGQHPGWQISGTIVSADGNE